jgi:hypothetical protein
MVSQRRGRGIFVVSNPMPHKLRQERHMPLRGAWEFVWITTTNMPHHWCNQGTHSVFLWVFWCAAATKPLKSGCGWCGLL